jgi:hypothetical protein
LVSASDLVTVSDYFSLGLTITSPVNQLTLRLDAIPKRLVLTDDETIFALGSTTAHLEGADDPRPGDLRVPEYPSLPDTFRKEAVKRRIAQFGESGETRKTRSTYKQITKRFHGG